MPISRRPVESKRRATRPWKDLDDILPKPPLLLLVPCWFRRKPAQHFIPRGGVIVIHCHIRYAVVRATAEAAKHHATGTSTASHYGSYTLGHDRFTLTLTCLGSRLKAVKITNPWSSEHSHSHPQAQRTVTRQEPPANSTERPTMSDQRPATSKKQPATGAQERATSDQ